MLDLFHTTDSENTKIYYTNASGSNSWQIWNKPPGCSFIYINALGGGGGGGAGGSRTIALATGGGGGGASTFACGFFPASILPDTLYIQVGGGGAGGAGGATPTAGSPGAISYVSVEPNTADGYLVIASGNTRAGGGGQGGTSIAGTLGTVGAVFTTTGKFTALYGDITTLAGITARAGGVGGSTLATSALTQPFCYGGLGGAGVTNAGTGDTTATITGDGLIPSFAGGASSTTFAGDGSNGFNLSHPANILHRRHPIYSTPGCGGGVGGLGGAIGGGGDGGDGGWGCGGGGGGASYWGSTTGGYGGRGGDGFVIITAV